MAKAAIDIRPRASTNDLQFTYSMINHTRKGRERKQRVGVPIEKKAAAVIFANNTFGTATKVDDRRKVRR